MSRPGILSPDYKPKQLPKAVLAWREHNQAVAHRRAVTREQIWAAIAAGEVRDAARAAAAAAAAVTRKAEHAALAEERKAKLAALAEERRALQHERRKMRESERVAAAEQRQQRMATRMARAKFKQVSRAKTKAARLAGQLARKAASLAEMAARVAAKSSSSRRRAAAARPRIIRPPTEPRFSVGARFDGRFPPVATVASSLDIYSLICQAVAGRNSLRRDWQDEIIQEVALAYFEGRAAVEDFPALVRLLHNRLKRAEGNFGADEDTPYSLDELSENRSPLLLAISDYDV